MRKKFILASGSKDRKEILQNAGYRFEVKVSDFEEDMSQNLSPKKMAANFALGKALAVAKKYKNAIVLGADTVIVFKNKVYGKPGSQKKAAENLRLFSGKWNSAITGVCIVDCLTGRKFLKVFETKFKLRKLFPDEIKSYSRTYESQNCAGGYACRYGAAKFIEKFVGEYSNAAGIPIATVSQELRKFGIKPTYDFSK